MYSVEESQVDQPLWSNVPHQLAILQNEAEKRQNILSNSRLSKKDWSFMLALKIVKRQVVVVISCSLINKDAKMIDYLSVSQI